jgi:hypothetical protein
MHRHHLPNCQRNLQRLSICIFIWIVTVALMFIASYVVLDKSSGLVSLIMAVSFPLFIILIVLMGILERRSIKAEIFWLEKLGSVSS